MSEKQRNGKAAALATYIAALVVVIAGLVIPINNLTFSGGGFDFKAAPVMQLAGALASFGLPLNAGFSPLYSFPLNKFDLGAALLFYYALTAAAALVLLVPAIIAKPERSECAVAAGELLALSALLPLCSLEVLRVSQSGVAVWNLNLIVPFAATLLMLAVQCLMFKKGSGVIKIVLFVLSAVAVLFAALDIIYAVPALYAPFEKAASAMGGRKPFEANTGLYTLFEGTVTGGSLVVAGLMNMFGLFGAGELSITVGNWFAFLAVSAALINLFFDMLGLAKKTTRLMIVCNVVRYSVEFAFIAALAITIPFMPSSYGLSLYIFAAISAVQLAIQSVRAAIFKKARRAAEAEREEEADGYAERDGATAALPSGETAAASNEAVETRNVVYNVNTIYNGPTDDFIRKLTSEQKVEFAQMFLERHTGASQGIPDYIVGGDNSRFFSMLFIYFARIRDLVSDGLMNKFYEEVKLM